MIRSILTIAFLFSGCSNANFGTSSTPPSNGANGSVQPTGTTGTSAPVTTPTTGGGTSSATTGTSGGGGTTGQSPATVGTDDGGSAGQTTGSLGTSDGGGLGAGQCWCAGGKADRKASFVLNSQQEAVSCARNIQAGHKPGSMCFNNAAWGICSCTQQPGWKISVSVGNCACIQSAQINAKYRDVVFVSDPHSP